MRREDMFLEFMDLLHEILKEMKRSNDRKEENLRDVVEHPRKPSFSHLRKRQ